MIIKEFDGLNFTLALCPRDLRVLYEALGLVRSDQKEMISNIVRADGLPVSPFDVDAIIRGQALELKLMALATARRTPPKPESAPDAGAASLN